MSTEDKKKEDINEIDSWEDLNPRIELLRGIYSNGFEKPSPIQRKAIIPLIEREIPIIGDSYVDIYIGIPERTTPGATGRVTLRGDYGFTRTLAAGVRGTM